MQRQAGPSGCRRYTSVASSSSNSAWLPPPNLNTTGLPASAAMLASRRRWPQGPTAAFETALFTVAPAGCSSSGAASGEGTGPLARWELSGLLRALGPCTALELSAAAGLPALTSTSAAVGPCSAVGLSLAVGMPAAVGLYKHLWGCLLLWGCVQPVAGLPPLQSHPSKEESRWLKCCCPCSALGIPQC